MTPTKPRALAQPSVSFNVRVPLRVNELRRDLEARTGKSGPALVEAALLILAERLGVDPQAKSRRGRSAEVAT
jgi:hypothetical protein